MLPFTLMRTPCNTFREADFLQKIHYVLSCSIQEFSFRQQKIVPTVCLFDRQHKSGGRQQWDYAMTFR